MTNDIKRIKIIYPGQILDYVDTKEHLQELFDYITNLEEEIKELNRMCEIYSKSLYNADLTKAENKIDKAIECIKICGINKDTPDNDIVIRKVLKTILNILEGSDKE